MAKAETFQDLSLSTRQANQELWRWLYGELRSAILAGRLRPGARLPSTRSLAQQYGVSRGTVVAAFDQLLAEGYTATEVGAGTYVANGLPDRLLNARRSGLSPKLQPSKATLSKRAESLLKDVRILPVPRSVGKAFRSFEPAIDLFPADLWARTAARVLRRAPRSLYGHGHVAGYPPLQRAIAEYVGASRGVRCAPEQVLVTTGAQQALDLIGRLLIDPGDALWMEDPGYPGALHALRFAGARIVAVNVDGDGMQVALARKLAPRARLAYVTPANQFPTGVTMSADRRMELLNWAAESGAWIVEDEYDAEYRYSGRPVAALQSLDRSGSVIYVGTFTKMLFNALRLGYLVLPERIVSAFERARSLMDRHPPTLDQAVLAEFITEGHFGHHVRRMRQIYAERLSVLTEAARQELTGVADVTVAAAGMRTTAWLKQEASDKAAADRAARLGLEVTPVSAFSIKQQPQPGLILGFAGCSPAELRRGVSTLARALTTPALHALGFNS